MVPEGNANPGQGDAGNVPASGEGSKGEQMVKVPTKDGAFIEMPLTKALEHASKVAGAEDAFKTAKDSKEAIEALGGMERIQQLAGLGDLIDSDEEFAGKIAEEINTRWGEGAGGDEGSQAGVADGEVPDKKAIEQIVSRELTTREGARQLEKDLTTLRERDPKLEEKKVIAFVRQRGFGSVIDAYDILYKDRIREERDKKIRDETAKAISEGRELGEPGGSPPVTPPPPDVSKLSSDELVEHILSQKKAGKLIDK